MEKMELMNTIFLGIITSFVASIVFTYLFTRLKPNLKISDEIAFRNGTFKIKIINKSKYAATNIKADMSYIGYFNVPGGRERRSYKIDLLKDNIFDIDKFEKKSEHANNTYRFVTRQNLREGFTESNSEYIRFKITATHSLSNIGKVFEKQYNVNQITNGEFSFGNITTIS
ncbi:hypothetical protein [Flavobacterium sp. WC2429]|jgi:hypothetical protein|uniref:DUF3592 domain-containing protein n=1 Tax=Flavobacterium sp. WC2429 TaxID=3234140 RepID=A0AB39WLY5_9FLAO